MKYEMKSSYLVNKLRDVCNGTYLVPITLQNELADWLSSTFAYVNSSANQMPSLQWIDCKNLDRHQKY